MKLLEVEGGGHVPQCSIASDATGRENGREDQGRSSKGREDRGR